jgi:DNA-binding MarR family transcriptional regulator
MSEPLRPAPESDLVLLLQACSVMLNDRVLADTRSAAGGDLRTSDGFVFQHLLVKPMSVTELGKRLGVSQQAASKQIADLQARDLVTRTPNPEDARSTLVMLTRRAHRAIQAARTSRERIADDLASALGPAYVADLTVALTLLSDHTGALARLLRREHRPVE